MPQGASKSKSDKTRRIEVFRPGAFRAMNGRDITFSDDDLKAIASSYDFASNPAPVVIGHPKTDDPAWGWIKGLEFDESEGRLFADIGDLDSQFEAMVSDGKFKRVSMCFHEPSAPNNPAPGIHYAKHVGFLGAKAPAVSGLKPVQFAAGDDDVVIVFGEPAFSDIAGLFRKLRDWLIEKEGSEEADKVLSDWQINWIDNAAHRDEGTSRFSEGTRTMPTEAELAAREAALTEREARAASREASVRHDAHSAFAEGLNAEARLPKASIPAVVALMDAVAGLEEDTSVSFAEGDATVTEKPVDTLKRILKAQPVMVEFGGTDLGDDPNDGKAISFATPDGASADPEGLKLHAKAVAFQKSNPGSAYLDAVAAVR